MYEFETIEKQIEPFFKLLQGESINTYISPLIKTPKEALQGSPLFLDMVDDADIIFDKDGFFSAILDNFKNRLNSLGAKRIWMGNSWYWVLKPDFKPGEVFEL